MGHFKEDVSSEVGLYQTSINNQTETYLGQWDKGVFEGIGMYIYSDNSIYMGNYRHDTKHGPGFLN